MITFPLLSNVRHRAMMTPVSPLTRLIHVKLSHVKSCLRCKYTVIEHISIDKA